MAIDQNPYQAYTDGSVFSDNPLNLIIALYQGALDATRQAESAVRERDIMGRSKAINKAMAILTELLVSLDHARGGEISQNLKRLYSYMQVQLLAAHARQSAEPIVEVAGLLETLLEGWRGAGRAPLAASVLTPTANEPVVKKPAASREYASTPFYGGYLDEAAGRPSTAYSF